MLTKEIIQFALTVSNEAVLRVDELRLIAYPLIAGEGKALFATAKRLRGLEPPKVQQLQDGRASLIYAIG